MWGGQHKGDQIEMKPKKYPRIDKRQLDAIHKREFDFWEERFRQTITLTDKTIPADRVKILAFNLAFVATTEGKPEIE